MQFHPTGDNTITLLDAETGEYFHNKAGAYTEAVENYVTPSGILSAISVQSNVTLIDACLGLGYNTWAVVQEAFASNINAFNLNIVAAELDPATITAQKEVLKQDCFNLIPDACIDKMVEQLLIKKRFSLEIKPNCTINVELTIGDLREAVKKWQNQSIKADYIFHDPFSVNRMPELWTKDLFNAYKTLLHDDGKLLTYSIAGSVRGALIESGYHIGRTPGVGEKPGGTLATLDMPSGISLDEDERAYLETMAGIPYRDEGLKNDRKSIVKARQVEQQSSGRPSGTPLRNKMVQPRVPKG